MKRGRHKRVEKRYREYDRKKPRQLLGPVFVSFLVALVPIAFVRPNGDPRFVDWLAIGLSFTVALAVYVVWARSITRRLAERYNLLCSVCDKPLDSLKMSKQLPDEDKRADGEAPSRCPHCHTSIDDAAR